MPVDGPHCVGLTFVSVTALLSHAPQHRALLVLVGARCRCRPPIQGGYCHLACIRRSSCGKPHLHPPSASACNPPSSCRHRQRHLCDPAARGDMQQHRRYCHHSSPCGSALCPRSGSTRYRRVQWRRPRWWQWRCLCHWPAHQQSRRPALRALHNLCRQRQPLRNLAKYLWLRRGSRHMCQGGPGKQATASPCHDGQLRTFSRGLVPYRGCPTRWQTCSARTR